MRVVLTGAAGFIGSNLAHYWHAHHAGDELVLVDALTYAGRLESIQDLVRSPAVEFVKADICDAAQMNRVVKGASLLIHLAAETHNDRAIADPVPFVRTNVLGTAILLEACRQADVARFHHVSTDEVFGTLSLTSRRRFTEDSMYHPRGPYSASKAGADHLVRAWSETYGLRITLSNCGNNFGPYQFPEKLIPLAITRALRGKTIPVYGDGKNVRDWIYVEDHCSAVDVICQNGHPGSTYLVSAEVQLSNNDVIRKILAMLGKDPRAVEHVPDRAGHDRRYALDPSRLRNDLGWHPRFTFDRGLETTVAWYRGNEGWWSPLIPPR